MDATDELVGGMDKSMEEDTDNDSKEVIVFITHGMNFLNQGEKVHLLRLSAKLLVMTYH